MIVKRVSESLSHLHTVSTFIEKNTKSMIRYHKNKPLKNLKTIGLLQKVLFYLTELKKCYFRETVAINNSNTHMSIEQIRGIFNSVHPSYSVGGLRELFYSVCHGFTMLNIFANKPNMQ